MKKRRSDTRAKEKYNSKSYDRFLVSVPIGFKQVVDHYAKKQGVTVNSFVTNLIYDAIGAETVDEYACIDSTFKPIQTVSDPTAIANELSDLILGLLNLGIPATMVRTILRDEFEVSVPAATITALSRTERQPNKVQKEYAVILINYEEHNLEKWLGDKRVYYVFGVQRNGIRDFLGIYLFEPDDNECIGQIGQTLSDLGITTFQTMFVPKKHSDSSIDIIKQLFSNVIICAV